MGFFQFSPCGDLGKTVIDGAENWIPSGWGGHQDVVCSLVACEVDSVHVHVEYEIFTGINRIRLLLNRSYLKISFRFGMCICF